MAGNSKEEVIYEKLWAGAVAAFDRNELKIDSFLNDKANDFRRGITLIARPDFATKLQIKNFLVKTAAVAPNQYFYKPEEFHVTVLAIIPGSEFWREQSKNLPAYMEVLGEILKKRSAFSIAFRGITASPEAIMIQGFSADNALERLRDDLRAALFRRGLGENLDRRYKIATAHLTIVRFSKPMQNWNPLKKFLEAHRTTDFGTAHIRSLQLIESDWYASSDSVKILREYPLS